MKRSYLISYTAELDQPDTHEQNVLDEGSLLQHTSWCKSNTYESCAKLYANFPVKNYAKVIFIFNNYVHLPPSKDMIHRHCKIGQ